VVLRLPLQQVQLLGLRVHQEQMVLAVPLALQQLVRSVEHQGSAEQLALAVFQGLQLYLIPLVLAEQREPTALVLLLVLLVLVVVQMVHLVPAVALLLLAQVELLVLQVFQVKGVVLLVPLALVEQRVLAVLRVLLALQELARELQG